MRIALVALAIALYALPVDARTLPMAHIEAWCDGGIDGRYQHARVEEDGTITATNRFGTPEPWPTVATDPDAAMRWFAALEAATPVEPPSPKVPPMADGIECGLVLNDAKGQRRYDLPEVHHEIVQHIPGYH